MKFYQALTLALLSSVGIANAQTDDYLITPKGDTVKCKVTFSFVDGDAQYQLPGSKPIKITLDNATEYMDRSKKALYRAVYRDGATERLFTKVLENGPISLYEIDVTTPSENGKPMNSRVWYVGNGNDSKVSYVYGDAFFASTDNYDKSKDKLAEMLKSKPDIYNKYVAEKDFEPRPARKLVRLFNGATK